MTEKLCLRCDWTGETKHHVCPECGASLFRASGTSPPPRRRSIRRRGRGPSEAPRLEGPRSEAPPPLATPTRESFDPSAPDEPSVSEPVSRRGGWVAMAVVLLAAVVLGVVVERSTPTHVSPPVAGLQGDLVFLSPDGGSRSRMWIWDLGSGSVHRGPVLVSPLALVDAFRARIQGGWIGVVSRDGDQQVAALLRNFTPDDVPAPVLSGDLVSWTLGGDVVAAATKPPDTCSDLSIESLHLESGTRRTRLDRRICSQLEAMVLDGFVPHVGLHNGNESWISKIWDERAVPWVRGASLVAIAADGSALVVPSCDAPGVHARCGGLAYLGSSGSSVPYGDADVGGLETERFLAWDRDGRTGYVLGTYGEVRGVYAVEPIERPRPPRLVIASLATDVELTQSYGFDGGDLFVSRDGGLVVIRPDGGQVPLALPDDAPVPEGPILWIPAAGGA